MRISDWSSDVCSSDLLLHRLVAEEAGMGVGDRIELRLDGVDHPPLAMPEAGDRGSARRVEIAPAGGVDDVHAFALDGGRRNDPRSDERRVGTRFSHTG